MNIFKPHAYQETAISLIEDNSHVGLFLEMGLGKTVCTLTAIDRLMYDSFAISKVLVIAPKRVAESVWDTEVAKWHHLTHLTVSKVLGNERARRVALAQEADIYVINREQVTWLVELLGRTWDFDMVVIDELSSFKNSQSKRFKALRKVRPLCDRIVGLTGTPIARSIEDLWAQIFLLDGGERLGRYITHFRNRYFTQNYGGFGWTPKPEADEAVQGLIGDICYSMSAADWLDMPERVEVVVPVTLSPVEVRRYKEFERDMFLEYDNDVITASSAGVLCGKLSQLANGAIYADEGKNILGVHNRKLDALEAIYERSEGNSLLVFYWFKHDLERLKKKFPKAVALRDNSDIAKWNRGEIDMLLVHPASGGHGLNLQQGGNVVVWFGLAWSLELYQQANARLYRQGQTRESVIIHHLVTQGTIDERIMAKLAERKMTQADLIEAIKVQLNKHKSDIGKRGRIPA